MPEMWDLYDGERRRTGRTLARGTPIPRGLYHLVVSAWIVNRRGQYLLSQRHPGKAYPRLWECTGGSVLAGEDSLTGALREVREELGIALNPGDARLIHQARRDATQDFYDVWLFHADVPVERLILQETEVIGAKWVSREELTAMRGRGELHPLIDYISIL